MHHPTVATLFSKLVISGGLKEQGQQNKEYWETCW